MRVLVADDESTRAAVRRALAADSRLEICAEVADAAGAVMAAIRTIPDVCLLEVEIPGGGIAAARELRARLPGAKLVFLTRSDADRDFFAAVRAGAVGYLLKDMDLGSLPELLRAAHRGEGVLPGTLTARLLAEHRAERPRRGAVAADGGQPAFTSREWDVLELLQHGQTTRQIARRLNLTPATVRTHAASIVRKTGAGGRDEALARLQALS